MAPGYRRAVSPRPSLVAATPGTLRRRREHCGDAGNIRALERPSLIGLPLASIRIFKADIRSFAALLTSLGETRLR